MPLIIDGYNLLFSAGMAQNLNDQSTFQQDREHLLNILSDLIPKSELSSTTVVFDASYAPPGLPRTLRHQGITVHFATQYEDADSMIEALINQHTAPRKLTVVSSDHRVQRAARKRKALAIDSSKWYAEQKRYHRTSKRNLQAKPSNKLSGAEVLKWMEEFGEIDLEDIRQQLKSQKQRKVEQEQQRSELRNEQSAESTQSQSPQKKEDHWQKLAEELGLLGEYDLENLSNPTMGGIFPQEYLDQIAKEFEQD